MKKRNFLTFDDQKYSDLLNIFRTNQLYLSVLLIGYAAFLRMAYFMAPLISIPPEPGIGNYWMASLVEEPSIFCFSMIIGLLFIQAFIVNKLFFENRLYQDLSLYSGVFLILIGSILPDFLGYSSYLPANVFLLLALREILKIYRKTKVADIIFNTGLFIGLAVLFQPVYLVLLLVCGIALVNLKSGKFRDQFVLLSGTIMPIFLLGSYYFFTGQFAIFWDHQWTGAFSFPQIFDWHLLPIPSIAIMSILTLIVFLQYPAILSKTKMEVQIKITTIYWFLGGGLFVILFSPSWHNFHWQAITPILGLLLGIRFTKAKANTAEAWHWALVVLLFVSHFMYG